MANGMNRLRRTLGEGRVLLPGDAGFSAAKTGFNLAVQHQPVAVVLPSSAEDVAEAVRVAGAAGWPVAVQTTGHGIGVPAAGALLVNTRDLAGVAVDPIEGTATVGGGVRWRAVVEAGATYGLAPLNGTAVDVGVAGFVAGGGLPVHGSPYGYGSDHVSSFTLVTADGRVRRVDRETEEDLFWAVRGGKSNFGIITEVTIGLMPLSTIYGGTLTFPGALGPQVLAAWAEWLAAQPDEMTTAISFSRVPDLERVPPEMRGRHLVSVRVAYTGDAAKGEHLVAPLRALRPILDTVTARPYSRVGEIAADPTDPMPSTDSSGLMDRLDAAAMAAVLEVTGPDAAHAAATVELRAITGRLASPGPVPSALGPVREAGFTFWMVDLLLPGRAEEVAAGHAKTMETMAPVLNGHRFPNHLSPSDRAAEVVASCYHPADYGRLRAIKKAVDPGNTFRVNHNIPPAA
ncbi:FAD-binding oxidoreductase [Nonomuraea sp. NPDC050556]|uniref:FAD-binding oxidoreductase n=1 Tax=Nonomuraea sp. NPDC050556 TaxID=3364369 RepID=UPI00379CA1BB